jgi:hypothetical protein
LSDTRSGRDRLFDVMVFAPAGLAVTVVEEFPKLVEKGRHRVEGQVQTARLVGRFALQFGRHRLEQSLARLAGDRATGDHHGSPPFTQTEHLRGVTGPAGPATAGTDASSQAPATSQGGPHAVGGVVGALAIPNYDSLSASQVVQRLDGLSATELRDVRLHENAHRRRQTILGRVDQLLAGSDAGPQ